jgi:4-amino-4-deoxy-L-arabinose transferase-like glycosyltransferase
VRRRQLIWPVLALAAALDLLNLSRSGVQTAYYEAAVKSMAHDWKAFFFASLDPGGFITVDKPPVAFYPEAILVHLLGLNRWTIGVPQVLECLGTIAVLWRTVARRFGDTAGLIAAAVLALTPIEVAASHDNIPDPLLALLLVSAAWATLRGAEDGRLRWLLLAGLFVGLGFQTKTIAAFLALPALALGYWIAASASWGRRIASLAAGGAAVVICSLPWVLLVALTPAGDRPWIGGTTENTALDLARSRTGFDQFSPIGQNGFRPVGFGGRPGFTRLFNGELAGQGAWFLLTAFAAALLALWSAWRLRDRQRLGALVLFAVWALVHASIFSYATGIFHAYYLLALAPALAALVGIGWSGRLAVGGAIVVASLGEVVVLGRTPDYLDWLRPVAIALTALALVALFASRLLALVVAAAALVVAPAAWSVDATRQHQIGPIPMAGPKRPDARTSYVATAPPGLARYLLARRDGERWDVATTDAIGAAPLILEGVRVAALGGFLGIDPAGTPRTIGRLIAERKLRYVLTTDPAFGYFAGETEALRVVTAVRTTCPLANTRGIPEPPPAGPLAAPWTQALYDCKGKRVS